MNGGGGDDRITGSAGLAGLVRLRMNGGAGDDFLIGSDGDDVMDAGPGDDTMVCGAGHDVMAGNDGEDRMVWNHGDGSDVMDGDAGRDVAEVNGAPVADDDFAVRPNGVRVRFERRNLAPFELDIATTERLRVDGGGGDDRVRTARDLGGLIAGAFYGGEGADRLGGTEGADLLSGGPGRDVLHARDRAADRVDCGDGLDVAGVDRHDQVRRCELVLGGRPRVRLTRKVAETRAGVAFVRARCVATARCRGSLQLRRGRVALGGERFSIARGTGKTVRVRLNRRGRRLVSAASPKGAKVAVRIVARDATGNGWRSAARLRLRGEI